MPEREREHRETMCIRETTERTDKKRVSERQIDTEKVCQRENERESVCVRKTETV